MSDPFKSYATGLESPATHAYHVTPSDTEDLPTFCRALNVAVGGAVKVTASKDPALRARENLVQVLFSHNDFVTIR